MSERHATRVPTVLIGIGGIGGVIVRQVHQELRDYDKQFVQMLVLDTNTNDLTKSSKINIPRVQTSENKTVSEYLRQNKRFQEWFPMNPLINAKNLTQGAGQIRSVSRLGALASEDAHRFDTISQAIEAVNKSVGASLTDMTRIMIVGSVCGGTGSGMGIQLPFLVRDIIEEIANMPRAIIRGLFIMPDILAEVQDTDEKKNSVYVNGYAFLRELNAFNKAQTFKRGTEKLQIEHYRRDDPSLADDPTQMSHQIPYDFLFLIEKNNNSGKNIGGIDAYLSKAAQIVKAQLFASDMTSGLHSSEDNLIVSAVNKEGMNRYCGAGISRVIYPEDENFRYCTLRYSESLLQSYWLRIDSEVERNMLNHKRLMASNPSLMPMDPQQEYIRIFDRLTNPSESEVTVQMGFLKREVAYESKVKNDDGVATTQMVNHAANLCRSISSYVDKKYPSPELDAAGESYLVEKRDLLSDQAVSLCTGMLRNLQDYEQRYQDHIGTLTAGLIDAILGSDTAITANYDNPEKYPYNISAVLKDKHPIVARYILYYVRHELQAGVAETEANITRLQNEEDLFKKDYYTDKKAAGEDTTIENPATALSMTKPGMLSMFGVKSLEYRNLVDEIVEDAAAYVERTRRAAGLKLKKDVYTSVIKRMDVLIDVYEKFFGELESIMLTNNKERLILEQDTPRIQGSDIYVCTDSVCKEWLYKKFENGAVGEDVMLPDDVKHTFFDAIFNEYANKYKKATDSTAFVDKPISMRTLFETAILNPLTEKFKENAMQHIHMDIIEALRTEYLIHSDKNTLKVNNTTVNPANFTFEQYFTAIAVQTRNLASPYLSYSTVSEEVHNMLMPSADVSDVAYDEDDDTAAATSPTNGRVLCYWGVNDRAVARYQHKGDDESVDRDALGSMFGDSDGAVYFYVNDDSFDPKELVCYSSVYDLMIENLDKYRKGNVAEKAYSARLLRVAKSDFEVGTGASDYLVTVHPHLDARWHAHAYLPMLRIDEELEERKRIAKAFMLSIACKRVWYMELDYTCCWTFRQTGKDLPSVLRADGKPAVRGSLYTLYGVMDQNAVAVNDILRKANHDELEEHNKVRIGGVQPADIVKQPIMEGLIGTKYTEAELNDLEAIFRNLYSAPKQHKPINILRVIYAVYQDSYDLELVTWLVDNLIEYVDAYCLRMANGKKGLAKKLSETVIKEIGANFDTSGVDMQFMMICEAFL